MVLVVVVVMVLKEAPKLNNLPGWQMEHDWRLTAFWWRAAPPISKTSTSAPPPQLTSPHKNPCSPIESLLLLPAFPSRIILLRTCWLDNRAMDRDWDCYFLFHMKPTELSGEECFETFLCVWRVLLFVLLWKRIQSGSLINLHLSLRIGNWL